MKSYKILALAVMFSLVVACGAGNHTGGGAGNNDGGGAGNNDGGGADNNDDDNHTDDNTTSPTYDKEFLVAVGDMIFSTGKIVAIATTDGKTIEATGEITFQAVGTTFTDTETLPASDGKLLDNDKLIFQSAISATVATYKKGENVYTVNLEVKDANTIKFGEQTLKSAFTKVETAETMYKASLATLGKRTALQIKKNGKIGIVDNKTGKITTTADADTLLKGTSLNNKTASLKSVTINPADLIMTITYDLEGKDLILTTKKNYTLRTSKMSKVKYNGTFVGSVKKTGFVK